MRTDAICFGVLIALAHCDGRLNAVNAVIRKHRRIAAFAGLVLAAAIAVISVTPELQINAGLLALTSAALVLLASANANVIVPIAYLRPVMLWIGSRSFSLYLTHTSAMFATREIFRRALHQNSLLSLPTLAVMLAMMTILALCAEGTYRLVETPFRAYGRRIAKNWNVNPIQLPAFFRLWSRSIK